MSETTPQRRVGRPRRFDAHTERELLLDAGVRVIQRNGYAAATLADIVEEAGIARRALYRHFDSKDELLVGIFGRESAKVDVEMQAAVDAADTGRRAIEAWLEVFLRVFTDVRRRRRVEMLEH